MVIRRSIEYLEEMAMSQKPGTRMVPKVIAGLAGWLFPLSYGNDNRF